MIALDWLVELMFDSTTLSYSVAIIGWIKQSRPVVVTIVVIASDAPCAPIGLWHLLHCHHSAQLNDETIDICASSDHD